LQEGTEPQQTLLTSIGSRAPDKLESGVSLHGEPTTSIMHRTLRNPRKQSPKKFVGVRIRKNRNKCRSRQTDFTATSSSTKKRQIATASRTKLCPIQTTRPDRNIVRNAWETVRSQIQLTLLKTSQKLSKRKGHEYQINSPT
jgi:hypothetical protein